VHRRAGDEDRVGSDPGGPVDVQSLAPDQLDGLARDLRQRLIARVSATGGHLGPNLGVVELTIAMHRAFTSPHDVILFDTGHQAYVHKMLTGRGDLEGLRTSGGISGYPSRSESVHDVVENSHASTAISWADGVALGLQLRGEHHRAVVAVIGDGALTGGMAWEALNNVISHNRRVVIIVNDNGRSYAPTVGGMVDLLPLLGALYVGPVDGHDMAELESVLRDARRATTPVVVHVRTDKGRGHALAIADSAERFHGISPMDPETGIPVSSGATTWTSVFADALVDLASRRQDIVAVTAAMPGPTGLDRFALRYPERFVDVGIAEQHATTMAAGLAFAGAHPVVAVYATFLNRALDQVLMDCALHRAGVTFVLDRSGVTGDDGASHNGVWDLAFLRIVPGLRLAAPRDAESMATLLEEAINVADAPTVLRFPKGAIGDVIPAEGSVGSVEVLKRFGDDILIVAIGAFAALGIAVARCLAQQGIRATVVDPRWVLPVSKDLVDMARSFGTVAVLEDGVRSGGVADAVSRAIADDGQRTAVHSYGVPHRFLDHATRAEILEEAGLTVEGIAASLVEACAHASAAMSAHACAHHSEITEAVSPLPEARTVVL
jgi:1-deoxy-D-xylulose-5-phosphate synthase